MRLLQSRATVIIAVILGALYVATAYVAAAFAAGPDLRPTAATTLPRFVLPDLTGRIAALADHAGRIVIVHFFATWCEPCREEMPALRRLAERACGSVQVLAISVGEPELRVRRFADATPVGFPILLDRDSAVAQSWQVVSLPTTYVLDRDLTPILIAEQDIAWDSVDLDRLLGLASRNARQSGLTDGTRSPGAP
jgi:peroxiredoxin